MPVSRGPAKAFQRFGPYGDSGGASPYSAPLQIDFPNTWRSITRDEFHYESYSYDSVGMYSGSSSTKKQFTQFLSGTVRQNQFLNQGNRPAKPASEPREPSGQINRPPKAPPARSAAPPASSTLPQQTFRSSTPPLILRPYPVSPTAGRDPICQSVHRKPSVCRSGGEDPSF